MSILFWSCHADDPNGLQNSNSSESQENYRPNEAVVLGNQLENPYDLENMQQAFDNITTQKSNGRYALRDFVIDEDGDTLEYIEIPKEVVRLTHKYVKFLPKTQDELDVLKSDTSLVLFDHPLDYKITEDGDFYHDPSIADSLPTPQYATIKLNKVLNNAIQYQILSQLYLPEEDAVLDPTLLAETGNDQVVTLEESTNPNSGANARVASAKASLSRFANRNQKSKDFFASSLLAEAFRITDNDWEETSNTNQKPNLGDAQAFFWSRYKWTPKGTIRTFDTTLNRVVPIEGVTIRASRWFSRRRKTTDANGYFQLPRVNNKKLKYRIEFEREHFQIRDAGTVVENFVNGLIGRRAADVNLGTRKRNEYVDVTLSDASHRYYADVFRGAFYYYYGNIDGLKRPPEKKVLFGPQMKITAYRTNEGLSYNLHYIRYSGVLNTLISTIKMRTFGRKSDETIGTMIHELAHSTHAKHAGPNNFIFSELRMKETYAQTIEWYLTTKLYKDMHTYEFDYTNNQNDVRRNYPPILGYDVGYQYRYPKRRENDKIYTGFMVDLIDDYNQRELNFPFLPYDRVSGYTLNQVERAVMKNKTFTDLINDLKDDYTNGTEQYLNELKNEWQ